MSNRKSNTIEDYDYIKEFYVGIPTYGKKRIETVHGIEEPCTTPRDHYVTNVHYLFQREIIRCGLILRVIDLRNRGGGGDGTP